MRPAPLSYLHALEHVRKTDEIVVNVGATASAGGESGDEKEGMASRASVAWKSQPHSSDLRLLNSHAYCYQDSTV